VDGNGLPAEVVHEAMAPVQEILNYYSLEASPPATCPPRQQELHMCTVLPCTVRTALHCTSLYCN